MGIDVPGGTDAHVTAVFPNVPLFTDPPEALTALVERIEENAARVALHHVADLLGQEAPYDQGELARSFGADPATAIGGIELTGHTFAEEAVVGRIFSALPQAVVMDVGRRPGSGVNRAGIEALTGWATRHLGLDGKEARSAAFAMAATIKARGLEGHDYVNRALLLADPQLQTIFANAGAAVAEALVSEGAV